MSDAFIAGVSFQRGDGGSPEVFTSVGEVYNISGLGESNALVDVTNFDSAGNREYKGGLADGEELTVECNYLPANAQQAALITDVKNKTTRNVRFGITDGVTTKTLSFAVACLGWVLNPAVDNKNSIAFTLKISGAVMIS